MAIAQSRGHMTGTGRIGIALALLCSLACPDSSHAAGPPLRVSYYPQAVYVGEHVLFELQSIDGRPVSAEMAGKQLAEVQPAANGTAELSLTLEAPGTLMFRQGDAEMAFEVLFPDSTGTVIEENGFLWCEGKPAILAAHHRHPPKHDRRWEIAHLIKNLFTDTRPKIGSGTIVGASFMSEEMAANLDKLSGTRSGFWTRVAPPDALSEINALILSRARAASNTAMLIVALSSRDLRHGIDRLEYRIKVEWYLQGLQASRQARIFLAAPPLTARESEQFGDMNRELAASAEANAAIFVRTEEADAKTGVDEQAWLKTVLGPIDKVLKLR
jgi:hypothetical protein